MDHTRFVQVYDGLDKLFRNVDFALHLKRVSEEVDVLLKRMIILIHQYILKIVHIIVTIVGDQMFLILDRVDYLKLLSHFLLIYLTNSIFRLLLFSQCLFTKIFVKRLLAFLTDLEVKVLNSEISSLEYFLFCVWLRNLFFGILDLIKRRIIIVVGDGFEAAAMVIELVVIAYATSTNLF